MPGTPRWIWVYGDLGAYMVEAPSWEAARKKVIKMRTKWGAEDPDSPTKEDLEDAEHYFSKNDNLINYEGMVE